VQQYWLSRHVFHCVVNNYVVFLDSRSNKYLALPACEAAQLVGRVRAWNSRGPQDATECGSSKKPGDDCIKALVERNMITTDQKTGREAISISVPRPTRSLRIPSNISHHARFLPTGCRAQTAVRLVAACVMSYFQLRFAPLHRLLYAVNRLRIAGRRATDFCDLDALTRLSTEFQLLRPYLYTARDACLFDSLTGIRLLAAYRIFPSWVFGVRLSPFAAHCWLQIDDILVNDTIERVRHFTPIMVA
jgi:hypothetical protein